MRNLKKILALVLALVMSFSLMATANAFTDSEKVTDTYETAVTVLDGLKVFQGYDDGSFQPQGSITRAEVAAIIYRIVTGDVTDTQVGIYADYNKFDDVKSTSWYAGYVNFCANAEYIKGYDAKTFGPNDPVTGYQALAMILRALGYDKNGEFTGTSWQVQTAAVGENRGITKNISAGTLGTAASREVVAEILFRAILVDTVEYTPAFGYQIGDTSLGWETFELEEITGVVIANEYADLYSTSPLKAGKTELDVDGESYTVNYSTDLTDIGEARDAYITKGETVLYIADAGNTVFETGAASDIDSDKDFEKVTGLERDDATEDFINFDDGSDDIYEADIVINYSVKGDGTDCVTIKAGDELTSAEYSAIKDIFTDDDYADGWVVVGTKYSGNVLDARKDDISNGITFRNFVKEYLVSTSKDTVEVTESDNGEWLKVIDNDGDGEADYVLLTEFAMSVIERISKDGEYTLAALAADRDDEVAFNNTTKVDGDDIVTEDELAEDDVVIYTLIDGNYYMNIAEMVTGTVDKKGIDSKTETMTVDGTDYVQSHIGYTDKTNYMWDVTDAHTEYTYDLYLDHFGYVRLFIESDYDVFMLLTDGYYWSNNREDSYQATIYDVDADKLTDVDVNDAGDVDEFIADWTWHDDSWGNLIGANDTYTLIGSFASNIAGYTETGDGYTLKNVEDSTDRINYQVQAFDVDELDDRNLEALAAGEDDIQTTTSTQYYLVVRDWVGDKSMTGWEVEDVISWTGYKNAPEEAELAKGAVGYAVTHPTKTDGGYNVADVVVFETLAYNDSDTYFVYEFNNWDNWAGQRVEHVWGVGYNDEGVIDSENKLDVEPEDNKIWANGVIEFYEIYDDGDVDYIGSNYAKHNIYAGWVDTGWDVEDIDYIQTKVVTSISDVNVWTTTFKYIEEDAPIYSVTMSKGDYDVEVMDRDDVEPGDKVIIFTDKDGEVEYAIDVEKSVYTVDKKDYIYADLYTYDAMLLGAGEHGNYGLWNRIIRDTMVSTDPTNAPTVTLDGVIPTDDIKWTAGANNTYTVSVPYSVWSAEGFASKDFVVTPAAGNLIAIGNKITFVSTPVLVDVDTSKNTQTIVVYAQGDKTGAVTVAYTYVITWVPADGDTALKAQNSTYAVIEGNKFGFTNNAKIGYSELKDIFVAASKLSTTSWKYTNEAGVSYEDDKIPADADTENGEWKVTVKPQVGTPKTYTLTEMRKVSVANGANLVAGWRFEVPDYIFADETSVTVTATWIGGGNWTDGTRSFEITVKNGAPITVTTTPPVNNSATFDVKDLTEGTTTVEITVEKDLYSENLTTQNFINGRIAAAEDAIEDGKLDDATVALDALIGYELTAEQQDRVNALRKEIRDETDYRAFRQAVIDARTIYNNSNVIDELLGAWNSLDALSDQYAALAKVTGEDWANVKELMADIQDKIADLTNQAAAAAATQAYTTAMDAAGDALADPTSTKEDLEEAKTSLESVLEVYAAALTAEQKAAINGKIADIVNKIAELDAQAAKDEADDAFTAAMAAANAALDDPTKDTLEDAKDELRRVLAQYGTLLNNEQKGDINGLIDRITAEIADLEAAATPYAQAVAMAKDALEQPWNKDELRTAEEELGKLNPNELTDDEEVIVTNLQNQITAALDEIAYDDAVEAAETALEAAENDKTQPVKKQLEDAQTLLNDLNDEQKAKQEIIELLAAINTAIQECDDLVTAKEEAKKALNAAVDKIDDVPNSDYADFQARLGEARIAIDEATTEENVDAILAAAIIDLQRYSQAFGKDTDVVKALVTAGNDLPEVVTALQTSGMTLEKIAAAIDASGKGTRSAIVKAMVEADVSPAEIFDGYGNGSTAVQLAGALEAAGVKDDAIVAGYFDSLKGEDGSVTFGDKDGLTATRDGNDYRIAIAAGTEDRIEGTGVVSVVAAVLGKNEADLQVDSFETKNSEKEFEATTADARKIDKVKTDLNNIIKDIVAGNNDKWTATIGINGFTYVIDFVLAE